MPTLLLAYAPPALPGLGLALLLVWARAARLPVLLAALAGLGYSGFVWHPAGSPSPNQAARPTLTLLSYNVARGGAGRPERLAAQIQAQGADIVTLQETNGVDVSFAPALLAALPEYQASQTGNGGELLTLSRWPAVRTQEITLPDTTRRFLLTTFETPLGRVDAVNVHFSTALVTGVLRGQVAPTRDRRAEQLHRLLQQTGSLERVLVAGDFNTPPRGTPTDRRPEPEGAGGQGWGYTFPAGRPILRIDHVLARGLRPVSAEVLPAGGSDHRALRVTLQS